MIQISSPGYRPYYVDGGKDIGQVNLYGAGQIYYTANCGWLEHVPFSDDQPVSWRNDIKIIHTDDPVRANKINLKRTDNYYLYDKKLSLPFAKYYALFIHVSPPKTIGEYLIYETNTSLCFGTFVAFQLKCQDEDGELDSIILQTTSRTQRTAFADHYDTWEQQLKEDGIEIPSSALQDLLKKYKLIRNQ